MFEIKPMNIAVLGSGGREHALAYQLSLSKYCKNIFVVPGNGGISLEFECIDWDQKNTTRLLEILKSLKIDFAVIGPDQMLSDGVADFLSENGISVFGPSKKASEIEWSKIFAKELMTSVGVLTSSYMILRSESDFGLAAKTCGGYPLVVKYDGLALGKGVGVCHSKAEALEFFNELKKQYGIDAKIFAEALLTGSEVSLFALTDGEEYVLFDPACDHKRLGERNTGPNTGGMGAFSSVPWFATKTAASMAEQIFPPVLRALKKQGRRYQGLLYAGLMVHRNQYNVLEFNARFGDPETQCLVPRLQCDLLPFLVAATRTDGSLQKLKNTNLWKFSDQYCVNVVATAFGYPQTPRKGDEIKVSKIPDHSKIYFAATRLVEKKLYTNGGRVLSVSAMGDTLDEARISAYEGLQAIEFKDSYVRGDIAFSGDYHD